MHNKTLPIAPVPAAHRKPVKRQPCESPKGAALSSCIESLAEGWITSEDLCPACTRSFMAALDGITGPLAWSRGYRQRATGGDR